MMIEIFIYKKKKIVFYLPFKVFSWFTEGPLFLFWLVILIRLFVFGYTSYHYIIYLLKNPAVISTSNFLSYDVKAVDCIPY